ncbi:mitotic spindle assembly checkpoint protein MAD2B [Phlyctochytrium arcticum]|nr:mitotic spindle assembly checkpoint protein MAD2B [Phlyctochytrium arcticum]
MSAPTLSYLELVDTLIDFLEVSIHYILYIRNLYPPEIFEARRKYNVPVKMARYPVLSEYIRGVLEAIKPDLLAGTVSKLYIAIHDAARRPVEKFTFELKSLMEGLDVSVRKHAQTTINKHDIEIYLRSFLLKIAVCDSMLAPNPPECAFVVLVEMTNDEPMPTNLDPMKCWVPAEETEITVNSPSLVPLKTMDAGLLRMQLFVEESEKKGYSSQEDMTQEGMMDRPPSPSSSATSDALSNPLLD